MCSTWTDGVAGREHAPPWLALCAAVPGLALAAITAVMLALAAAGRHPAWPPGALTLSEAAALRDAGEVARLVSAGADPNAPAPVRAGILDSAPLVVTPLDAAVAARRAEIVSLLLARGAAPAAEEWNRLACSARRTGSADVERELSRWRKGAVAACSSP